MGSETARFGGEIRDNMAASEPSILFYKDGYGRTPLSLAAEKGHEAVVNLLSNLSPAHTAHVQDL
jgi:ankyrin repeat protein